MPDRISWREKAAMLRAAVERAADEVTRQSLLLLADDCDAFADEEAAASPADVLTAAPGVPTKAG